MEWKTTGFLDLVLPLRAMSGFVALMQQGSVSISMAQITTKGHTAIHAVLSYPHPLPAVTPIRAGHVSLGQLRSAGPNNGWAGELVLVAKAGKN